ncbi:Hydrogenase expression protein HypA [Pseudomonas coronafaciens pv. garcae]|nr:Hydrogenase expression protein HypA [Pseudomonas coronafaciens pv. garcae]
MLQDTGRKTSRQSIAWQGQNLPYAAQAHARHGSGRLATQPDAIQWHLFQGATQFMRAINAQAIMHVGQHPRCYRVGSNHDAVAETLFCQFFTQASLEHMPRPEQLEAGLDLHQQHPRVFEADTGAETVGPGSQQLLQLLGVGGVVYDRRKARHECLRRCQ